TFSVTDNEADPPVVTNYEVTAVTKDGDDRVISVTLQNIDTEASSSMNTTAPYTSPPDLGGGTGSGFESPPSTPGTPFRDIRGGGNGGDGRDGGGVCFGALGCVSYDPGNGGSGGTRDPFTSTVELSWGSITTGTDNNAGIVIV